MRGRGISHVSSSKAKDPFCWRQEGECLVARNGKHRIAGKVGAVFPVNGLAKEEGKRGRKRFLAALEMTV